MTHDFSGVHAALKRHVDAGVIAGTSHAVLLGQEVVDTGFIGHAVRETAEPMGERHLFRMFSNTKLVASMALLQLWEQGRVQLDDPVGEYIPALARMRVFRSANAPALDDTEPARRPITLRHLLTHVAGFTLALFDPQHPLSMAYMAEGVHDPRRSLAEMMEALGRLPLLFHPGEGWNYSVATDVVGRVVEVVSGQGFGQYLQQHIFQPLGMVDTGFFVPPGEQHRLAGYYLGADPLNPMVPGLTRVDPDQPYPGAYLSPPRKESGGGGLVSSLPDTIALMRSLLPGGPALLKPETLAMLPQDQLPEALCQQFPIMGSLPFRGHGLASGMLRRPGPADPAGSRGEYFWGGVAGTQWFVQPRLKLAGILMTQRVMGFIHPVGIDFHNAVYAAVEP